MEKIKNQSPFEDWDYNETKPVPYGNGIVLSEILGMRHIYVP